ncbi:MAG: hypothetical protein ACYC4N_02040 [Pirellulaceae bacterium]
MSSPIQPGHFATRLLQQDQPFSESQYKEYRMKLEDALTAAQRRERRVGHAAWMSFLIAGVLMFFGGSRVVGSFDPWSRDATVLSVTLGAIYCIAMIIWPLAIASYFSRFRPRVRDIKEQIRDTTILALQCEISELRALIGATRRDDTT